MPKCATSLASLKSPRIKTHRSRFSSEHFCWACVSKNLNVTTWIVSVVTLTPLALVTHLFICLYTAEVRANFEKEFNAETNEDKKKELRVAFEEQETKARKRSLGNVRFIGELYKLGMLTGGIMHRCVQNLVKCIDEESLECLCKLLTTVGKNLENETKVTMEVSINVLAII